MNQIFDEIRAELQFLTRDELTQVAQNEYGLDWVTNQTAVKTVLDACVAVEQENFFK